MSESPWSALLRQVQQPQNCCSDLVIDDIRTAGAKIILQLVMSLPHIHNDLKRWIRLN